MKLSIVTTLYRSADFVDEFYRRASSAAAAYTDAFELIFVNDGSPDASLRLACEIVARDARVRVVDLSRNFGHHQAIMAGLANSTAELVCLLDCDLEEEPELLTAFLAELERTGADVVYGVQVKRKGGPGERIWGGVFYRLFNLLSDQPIPRNLVTARLMTRPYVDALLRHDERELFLGGLWAAVGFDQRPVRVTKGSRGGSSYSLRRRIALFVNAITSFSSRPLILVFYLGAAIVVVAAAGALYLIVRRIWFSEMLVGWASLIVSVWLLGGLTIYCIGLVGIYLSKIFGEVKRRPTVIRKIYTHPLRDDGPRTA